MFSFQSENVPQFSIIFNTYVTPYLTVLKATLNLIIYCV